MIHDLPPGKDYYNWTGRCLSAGAPYNPYKIEWDLDHPERCGINEISLCRLGDLGRHGMLAIAGRKRDGPQISRKLFTDELLPLSGPHSILGKSLVIYDDHGPVARGERLACTMYLFVLLCIYNYAIDLLIFIQLESFVYIRYYFIFYFYFQNKSSA